MTVQEFFNKYLNQSVEAEDPSNLFQCMDLAFKYCDEMAIPRDTIRHLYASQVYTQPNDNTVKYFELIPNTPSGIPQVGDVPVFGTVVGIAGHICIATGEGNVSTFKSMDQNWNNIKKAVYVNHTYDGILGWLRIRKSTVVPSPVITDSTRIPQIDNLSVDQIRSERNDMRSTIQQLKPKADKFDNIKNITNS